MCILAFCRKLVSIVMDRRYRPELHYMRGPGPKWIERHGNERGGNGKLLDNDQVLKS